MTNTTQAELHLVVFVATSFVGQILSRYLMETYGTGGEVRWAIPGRSESKLASLKAELGDNSSAVPVIQADASVFDTPAAMCRQTRVIISAVGPFALYGAPLVKACVSTGNDYCDLSGEVQFIRRMIER